MADHDVGEIARLSCAFTVAAAATDPTTVALTVVSPAGTSTTYTYAGGTLVKDSTGNYHKDLTPADAGWWRYYWIGTGACAVTEQAEFYVRPLAAA